MSRSVLKRSSVPDEIAGHIQERVMAGAMRPGERLREAVLASEFDASRNTIREALLLLESRGFLERSPHRGARVMEPEEAAIREIMALRRVVEPGAVRLLCLRASRAPDGAPDPDREPRTGFDQLREIADGLEAAAGRKDWERYGILDLRFHSRLVGEAGGALLEEAFTKAVRPLYLHLLAADFSSSVAERRHVAEHRELLDRIARGATSDALECIDRHLSAAEAALPG